MWTSGKVIERIDWNDKLFSLRIEADIGSFIPGQFIKLSQVIDNKRIGRAYSLVNPPSAPYIEILAIAVNEGQLSPNLHSMQVGDRLDVSTKAAGFMTLNELPVFEISSQHLWFLATGTAVGPFLSMMQTRDPWDTFEKVVLVYGVREAQDLAYLELLHQLEAQYPDQFKLVLSVTRQPAHNALNCRIPQGLANGEIEAKAGLIISASHSQVMICGNPGMVADSQKILLDKGLAKNLRRAPGQITVEKYW